MSETSTRTMAESAELQKLEEQLQRKKQEFGTLLRLFRKLKKTSNLAEVIKLFAEVLITRIGYVKVAFYLHRPASGLIEPYYCSGGDMDDLPALHPGSSLTGLLAGRNDFVEIGSFRDEDEGGKAEREGSLLAGNGYIRAIPIMEDDQLIGAIFLGSGPGPPPDMDQELAEIVYRIASILIRALWLHRQTTRSRLELEKFSDVKKRFIGHTSHELRTPLTVVRSAVDSIEGKESDQELISMAKNGVEKLQNTVEILLSYNDIELRSNAFEMVLSDAASIVKDCIRELARDFEENDIAMSIENSAGRVLTMLDRSKIRLVFRSLIENAMNYVEEEGRVDIEMLVTGESPSEEEGIELGNSFPEMGQEEGQYSGREDDQPAGAASAKITRSSECSYFVCRIGDNGIGIPESEIRFISEPFRMASNSPLNGVKGLGMGLTISQRIVAGHGGRLFCRSGEGAGSIFSVWLPVNSEGAGPCSD
ncbi:MAG: hypothetical protein GF417_05020 [Candidatus Latescibacteria bacterium]|nr:hypothetical protein [bacterium]MBD3423780.1 hypothetical protein [Candidatus Latescibacterota bacterium]